MKVKTLTPVQFDGKDVEVGTTIEVSKKAGEQLLESGSAELVGKAHEAEPAKAEK